MDLVSARTWIKPLLWHSDAQNLFSHHHVAFVRMRQYGKTRAEACVAPLRRPPPRRPPPPIRALPSCASATASRPASVSTPARVSPTSCRDRKSVVEGKRAMTFDG